MCLTWSQSHVSELTGGTCAVERTCSTFFNLTLSLESDKPCQKRRLLILLLDNTIKICLFVSNNKVKTHNLVNIYGITKSHDKMFLELFSASMLT